MQPGNKSEGYRSDVGGVDGGDANAPCRALDEEQGIFVVDASSRRAADAEPVEVGAQDELPLAAGGIADAVGFVDVGGDLHVVAGALGEVVVHRAGAEEIDYAGDRQGLRADGGGADGEAAVDGGV